MTHSHIQPTRLHFFHCPALSGRLAQLVLIVLSFGVCLTPVCQAQDATTNTMSSSKPVMSATDLDAVALKQWLQREPDTLLLDVREMAEWNEGHLPNATLLPLGELTARAASALPDPRRPIVVYCRSGRRSQLAIEQLRNMGYSNLKNLKGGIIAWQEAGFVAVRP